MNAVEIEEAVSQLAEAPFDSEAFPFAFLEAFGNKSTTIKRLKSSSSNQSDLPGGVLQRNNIHLKVCSEGEVTNTLTALRESPATTKYKTKFILATDGKSFEAENLADGETIACNYPDFHDHFGFFLPLAGITTVRQIRENAFDIKATGRLNRLYVELLKNNPDWDTADRREALNHFMARLIFCFFAEDTNIFHSNALFTATVEQMSASDSSNTHEVLSEMFRAMCTPLKDREAAKIRNWANVFPYVNGGLFSGGVAVPRFSKISRSYLLHVGNLDWTKINPDIFGSMIQAVADDEERGALGMHYTSVPNILKVLNPLFLDDLRAQLEAAGDNARKLLNLRKRIARIRVFDPACGSGNFLVIAYKQMRAIEAEINQRRGEPDLKSEIPLTNFRGIEIRHFSCEIARLALIIAEYQCDVLYRGPKLALAEFLPLKADNWITCGNALRLDWLSLCPPTGTGVKVQREDLDLWGETREEAEIDFENEGGETYICGNPPYLGSTWQSKEQKDDLKLIFDGRTKLWKSLDYVSGWFMKAADYGTQTTSAAAFVSTNSICQGQQVPILWPLIFETGHEIAFAHTSFKWANLASHNAGVTVVIVGISNHTDKVRCLFSVEDNGETVAKEAGNINAYLVASSNVVISKTSQPVSQLTLMDYGNKPTDDGGLILSAEEYRAFPESADSRSSFVRRFVGSNDAIDGSLRYCLWIENERLTEASEIPTIFERLEKVKNFRSRSSKAATNAAASWSHRFQEIRQKGSEFPIVVPRHSSENREFLPFALCEIGTIVADSAFALYDAPLWNMALIASRLHLVWIATVCGKLETRYRYSNTLGWNTFPVPTLTEQNKTDLTRCAEDILLAREAHFPATIADLYAPEKMPENLRQAHDRNDEILERIYIGRRFKNDTERLEKLFELYTQMTARQASPKKSAKRKTQPSKPTKNNMVTLENLEQWLLAPAETEKLEFKEAKQQYDTTKLLRYCVALANEGGGHLVLGVTNKPPRNVVGTQAFPSATSLNDIKALIVERLRFRVDVRELNHSKGRVLVFEIPTRPVGQAFTFEGAYLMRAGEDLVPMTPDMLKRIFAEDRQDWFSQAARSDASPDNVIALLDTQTYFELLDIPYPTSRDAVLERLQSQDLIKQTSQGWTITNLAAILLAKKLDAFSSALARKAPRFVIYEGINKLQTRDDKTENRGYAVGFEGLVDFVHSAAPQNRFIEEVMREEIKMFPKQALRELIANALVHQDFLATGASVMIEMYGDRIEISNPGIPPIQVERFIDEYRSRNEQLADLMRRFGICEEKGSGIDKVVSAAELFQLPAPDFRVGEIRTTTVLFAHQSFAGMSKPDRIRACYQHCCLLYVSNKRMSNQTLRDRFRLSESGAATVSLVIKATKEAGLIKMDESESTSTRYASYLPFWA